MKFELLRKKVIGEYEGYEERDMKELQEGNMHLLRHYLTDLRIKQLADGKITQEQAVEIATKKIKKEYKKRIETILGKIAVIEQAPDIQSITVNVEWTRNRTWGANPSAFVFTHSIGQTVGHASGCGYDKESSAIASAFNQNVAILKILYAMKERALQDNYNMSSCDACGYGAGYGAVPYFEGGVGVTCFISIFSKAGFNCAVANGKMSASYIFNKKEVVENG